MLNDIPVRQVGGATVYLRDVAQVRDGFAVQTNMVHVEDALVAFSRAQATRAQLAAAVRADRRAAELAHQLYGQGLTDFLTVFDAERSLFTAQDTLAQSQEWMPRAYLAWG
ncbi:MAG: hypothetical protein AUI36_16170 [Cyanobacteria bacterium 13_1_40CM_2_61_4]|nr:MAG: hypothetical protein AUI36_16170 [Cyanobacteria bacterium 13_1_40CM_2_61_4]